MAISAVACYRRETHSRRQERQLRSPQPRANDRFGDHARSSACSRRPQRIKSTRAQGLGCSKRVEHQATKSVIPPTKPSRLRRRVLQRMQLVERSGSAVVPSALAEGRRKERRPEYPLFEMHWARNSALRAVLASRELAIQKMSVKPTAALALPRGSEDQIEPVHSSLNWFACVCSACGRTFPFHYGCGPAPLYRRSNNQARLPR